MAAHLRKLGRELEWPGGPARARRWATCQRAGIQVIRGCMHSGSGPATYVPLPCELRTCPGCARRLAAAAAARYTSILHGEVSKLPPRHRRGRGWKLLTLTRKNPGGWDPVRLRRQVRETRRLASELLSETWLRPGSLRKNRPGVGAVWAVEISPPKDGSPGAMVHVHALVWGEYVRQSKLSDRWLELTGDSYIVDIRKVRVRLHDDPEKAIRSAVTETLKYSTKAQDAPIQHLAAIEYALDGTRRLQACGMFYGKVSEYEGRELATDGLTCERCDAPAFGGIVVGVGGLRDAFRNGARWHPGREPPGWTGPTLPDPRPPP